MVIIWGSEQVDQDFSPLGWLTDFAIGRRGPRASALLQALMESFILTD